MSGETALDGQRSLYILSPGDRDGLSQLAQSAGWRVIAARRATDAAQQGWRAVSEAMRARLGAFVMAGEQNIFRLVAIWRIARARPLG